MLKGYINKFIFRIIVFLIFLVIYFFKPELIDEFFQENFFASFTILHILWVILLVDIIIQMLPKSKISVGSLKQFQSKYKRPKRGFNKTELNKNIIKMNNRALIVMGGWIFANLFFGLLSIYKIISYRELLLLTFLYSIGDLVCIIIYCPFQHIIMRNRCCVTCRIFNWDHFMMHTPMLFIMSFYSWILFFLSLIALVNWEVSYKLHPERFWEGSNTALRCSHCSDKICKIKKPIYNNA